MNEKAVVGTRRAPWLVFLLFWLVNLLFLLRFVDRDGYEGDDLNMVVPIAHLEAAKQGALLIYRYAWQPLSFEQSALLWRMFGTPDAVFLSMAVAGAFALGLFFYWLWREGRPGSAALANALLVMLAIPELWYSSLYYNSTVRALPLIAVALLLVRGRGAVVAPIVAGILTGIAILTRLDFLLICPLLALASWPRGTSIQRPILLAAGVVATLLVGYVAGYIDIAEILRINAFNSWEIAKNADRPGWDRRLKTGVLSVVLSPVGWLMLLAGLALLLPDAWRRRDWRALAWIAFTLPPLYPALNLLSPKYLLTLAPFALLFFLRTVEAVDGDSRIAPGQRLWIRRGLWAAGIVPLFFSISLSKHAPFVMPGLAPERSGVPTHDGARAWGGYVWQMMDVDGRDNRKEKQRAGDQLLHELLDNQGENIVYLGSENLFDDGGVGWRHVQLGLYDQGFHSRLIAPHTLRFDLPNHHWLILGHSVPRNLAGQRYRLIDVTSEKDEAQSEDTH